MTWAIAPLFRWSISCRLMSHPAALFTVLSDVTSRVTPRMVYLVTEQEA